MAQDLWFCHECHAEMRPLMVPDPVCASCSGSFVEKIESPTENLRNFTIPPSSDERSDGTPAAFGLLRGLQEILNPNPPNSPLWAYRNPTDAGTAPLQAPSTVSHEPSLEGHEFVSGPDSGTVMEGKNQNLDTINPSPDFQNVVVARATLPSDAGSGAFLNTVDPSKKSLAPPKSQRTGVQDMVSNVTFPNESPLRQAIASFRDSEAQTLLDVLQNLLDSPGIDAVFRRHLIVATQRLSRRAGLYPLRLVLEGVQVASEHALVHGGFADIYKGHFLDHIVCLKMIRLYQSSQTDAFLKQFSSEAILWSQLSHPNLLPIYGLYFHKLLPCFVSPWMEHGDINHFLQKHPDANRKLLVLDVASGLAYLHKLDIVHGDLKGPNILVDASGRARLGDFGLSAVSDINILQWTSQSATASKGGSVRWQASELFDEDGDEVVHNSKPSDIYALTSVMYEILTGNLPFHEHGRDATVIVKVLAGVKPSRPPPSSPAWESWGLTESLWSLMEVGWSPNPDDRPTIHQILSRHELRKLSDVRPSVNESDISPAHVRHIMHSQSASPPVDEVESLLDRTSPGPA